MHSLLDRYKSRPKDKAVRLGSHVYRQECMTFCRNSYKVELIATALNVHVPRWSAVNLYNGQGKSLPVGDVIQQPEGATASFYNRGQT